MTRQQNTYYQRLLHSSGHKAVTDSEDGKETVISTNRSTSDKRMQMETDIITGKNAKKKKNTEQT